MKISKKDISKTVAIATVGFFSLTSKIFAEGYDSAHAMKFDTFDTLLWTIIKTVQYYTLPVMAIAIVLLGVKLLTSGDDTSSKETVKNWMVKILIGGVIIFGAATIASLIKGTVDPTING